MKISASNCSLLRCMTDEESLEVMSRCGFDAVDLMILNGEINNGLWSASQDEFCTYFEGLKKAADGLGIEIGQTHAPFPSYRFRADAGEENSLRLEICKRSVVAASILGAPYIVIHPPIMPLRRFDELYEENMRFNIDFFNQLKPLLAKYGVKLGIENMWNSAAGENGSRFICPTTCSGASEMLQYIEKLGSGNFCICYDIGHASLTKHDLESEIISMGSNLKALHISDNDGRKDQHIIPGFGYIKWDRVCDALKKAGYEGNFNMEVGFGVKFSDGLLPELYSLLYKVGRDIVERYLK